MKRKTLELLVCPTCHGELFLSEGGANETIDTGMLACAKCRRQYPIKEGIPHFIEPGELVGPNARFARFYDRFTHIYFVFNNVVFFLGGVRKSRKEEIIEGIRRENHARARVEFRTADVLDLPFEADRFDVVLAESVLVFVEDKARAIRECVRVAKPGGYVGLNEGLWIRQPPPELVAQVKAAIGPFIPTSDTWQALWEASGLQERVVKICQVDARTEVRTRIRWIGWRWLLRAWGRGLRLYITSSAVRQSIKGVFDVPPEAFQYAGYGLFAGRK